MGFSSIQKCTAAICYLAYEAPTDVANDYLRMAKSTCFETVTMFCRAVVAVFWPNYLRARNEEYTARILAQNMQQEVFLDAREYRLHAPGWKNRPFVWQGLYKGHTGE
jgi:hypothetical protein